MSSLAVLIATAKIRPGSENAFAEWKGRHDAVLATFAGFNSSDMMPPAANDDRWTFLLNFDSQEHLAAWQSSEQRAVLLAELLPLTLGGDLGEAMHTESAESIRPETSTTQVIFSRIKPGMEERYRAWTARIQQAQALYPGYQGTFIQPPTAGGTQWITMLRYETNEQLDRWMAAPERKALLREATEFIENEELLRLATSFPGWVPLNPSTGKGPPDWKTALLVLLGLYPIVVLIMTYLSPLLRNMIDAYGLFIGNIVSVSGTSFVTMPILVRAFNWWLFTDAKNNRWRTLLGLAILAVIFACEIAFFAWLLPPSGGGNPPAKK
jgi:antibiotic biosynthesis monooxygenase (ABM) superfamily enzyme